MLQCQQVRLPTVFHLLPAIDLRGGLVVRLSEGDFTRETVYGADPEEVARRFAAAGARWIHIVDLDGAREGEPRQAEVVTRIVAAVGPGMSCEVAGGLRDEATVDAALAAGAARAVIGTAALRDPALVERLVTRLGPDRIAIALDVRDGMAVGQGWIPGEPGVPAHGALTMLADRGARTFIVTAVERDGLLAGPNLELLGRMVALGRGEVVASAGLASLEDIAAVRALGCAGAIVGRALYEGRVDLAAAVRLVYGEDPQPRAGPRVSR
ncbi:MAG TPA: 1-(5-phosphoribosyl)-5-[(5-phosphoribosylamino)methylideneamino] imidazole-4-carboxamide isomerase [Candidatus Limnocylindrales bacterium]|jgi:Phosphoribosylformimino-5-aminoimidazole carboxamide ribonucleotide (ProFAR) isomerase|nr:1-(5-phosphoribosyl)-5-[(5-phosphoribosylamino)methylideneamino] imidazole-4-carboxamide isomerase [Candidatus Limnocylindrales bacterium]